MREIHTHIHRTHTALKVTQQSSAADAYIYSIHTKVFSDVQHIVGDLGGGRGEMRARRAVVSLNRMCTLPHKSSSASRIDSN